jgi:hypothetical protein
MRDPLVQRHAPMLAVCAGHIRNLRVRTRGTIGGSVAHADPAAGLPCTLPGLGARIGVEGQEGRRTIAAGYLVTSLTTALNQADLVASRRKGPLQRTAGLKLQGIDSYADGTVSRIIARRVQHRADVGTPRRSSFDRAGRPEEFGQELFHIGRVHSHDEDDAPVVVDWRAGPWPAAQRTPTVTPPDSSCSWGDRWSRLRRRWPCAGRVRQATTA